MQRLYLLCNTDCPVEYPGSTCTVFRDAVHCRHPVHRLWPAGYEVWAYAFPRTVLLPSWAEHDWVRALAYVKETTL